MTENNQTKSKSQGEELIEKLEDVKNQKKLEEIADQNPIDHNAVDEKYEDRVQEWNKYRSEIKKCSFEEYFDLRESLDDEYHKYVTGLLGAKQEPGDFVDFYKAKLETEKQVKAKGKDTKETEKTKTKEAEKAKQDQDKKKAEEDKKKREQEKKKREENKKKREKERKQREEKQKQRDKERKERKKQQKEKDIKDKKDTGTRKAQREELSEKIANIDMKGTKKAKTDGKTEEKDKDTEVFPDVKEQVDEIKETIKKRDKDNKEKTYIEKVVGASGDSFWKQKAKEYGLIRGDGSDTHSKEDVKGKVKTPMPNKMPVDVEKAKDSQKYTDKKKMPIPIKDGNGGNGDDGGIIKYIRNRYPRFCKGIKISALILALGSLIGLSSCATSCYKETGKDHDSVAGKGKTVEKVVDVYFEEVDEALGYHEEEIIKIEDSRQEVKETIEDISDYERSGQDVGAGEGNAEDSQLTIVNNVYVDGQKVTPEMTPEAKPEAKPEAQPEEPQAPEQGAVQPGCKYNPQSQLDMQRAYEQQIKTLMDLYKQDREDKNKIIDKLVNTLSKYKQNGGDVAEINAAFNGLERLIKADKAPKARSPRSYRPTR